jgi:hypothetical protein
MRHARHQRCANRSQAAADRATETVAANILAADLSGQSETQTGHYDEDTTYKINQLQTEIVQLQEVVQNQQSEIHHLKEQLEVEKKLRLKSYNRFSADFLSKNSDFRTKFVTGLPSMSAFMWLLNICALVLPTSQLLTPRDIL